VCEHPLEDLDLPDLPVNIPGSHEEARFLDSLFQPSRRSIQVSIGLSKDAERKSYAYVRSLAMFADLSREPTSVVDYSLVVIINGYDATVELSRPWPAGGTHVSMSSADC